MQLKPTVRKIPADSVPYGRDISTRGGYVYATYDGDEVVAVGATAGEARRKYSKAWSRGFKGRTE